MTGVLIALGIVGLVGIASVALRHQSGDKRKRSGDGVWFSSGDGPSGADCDSGDGGCDGVGD